MKSIVTITDRITDATITYAPERWLKDAREHAQVPVSPLLIKKLEGEWRETSRILFAKEDDGFHHRAEIFQHCADQLRKIISKKAEVSGPAAPEKLPAGGPNYERAMKRYAKMYRESELNRRVLWRALDRLMKAEEATIDDFSEKEIDELEGAIDQAKEAIKSKPITNQ